MNQVRQEYIAEQPPYRPAFVFTLPSNGKRVDSRIANARWDVLRLRGLNVDADPADELAFEETWRSANPFRGIRDPLGTRIITDSLPLVSNQRQPLGTARVPKSFLDQLTSLYLIQANSNSRQCIVFTKNGIPFVGTYTATYIPPSVNAIVGYNHAANRLAGGSVQDVFKNVVPDDGIDSVFFIPDGVTAAVFSLDNLINVAFVVPTGEASAAIEVDAQTYQRIYTGDYAKYHASAKKLSMALEVNLIDIGAGGDATLPTREELPPIVQPGMIVNERYRVGFVWALVNVSRTMWRAEPTEAAVVHPSFPLTVRLVASNSSGPTTTFGTNAKGAGDAWVWPKEKVPFRPSSSSLNYVPAFDVNFPLPLVHASVISNRPVSARERLKWTSLDSLKDIQYLPTVAPSTARPGLVVRYRDYASECWRYDSNLMMWIDVASLTPRFKPQQEMQDDIITKMPACVTCYAQDLSPININPGRSYDCKDSVLALREISPAECTLEYILCSLPENGDDRWGLSKEQVKEIMLKHWYPFARGDWAFLARQKVGVVGNKGNDNGGSENNVGGDALYTMLAIANQYVLPDEDCTLTEAAARMAAYVDAQTGAAEDESAEAKQRRLNQAIVVLVNLYVPVVLLGGSPPASSKYRDWVQAMVLSACPTADTQGDEESRNKRQRRET